MRERRIFLGKRWSRVRNKKVLVTGADGFIGSHLVESLLKEGCRLKAFVYYNSFNSWGWLDTLQKEILKDIEVFTGDVRDPNGVREAVKDVDMVFHLAALISPVKTSISFKISFCKV